MCRRKLTESSGNSRSDCYGTSIGDQVRQGSVSKLVQDASVQMMTQTEVMAAITAKIIKRDDLMSPITNLAAKTVELETENVD